MNLEQQILYSCSAWSSIHPNRAAVLNHLFVVLGNGYEWSNGALVSCEGGTRLGIRAAINKVFRERRARDKFRAAYERKRKRDEKKALEHTKHCQIKTRCTCGMYRIDDKDHTKWCARNFPNDILRCSCGAQPRIDEHTKSEASLDALIDKVQAQISKLSQKERDSQVKKATAALKITKRQIRADKLNDYRVPTDIKKRIKDTDFDHWYPVSTDYPSYLLNFPEDIQNEWLEGVIETAKLIQASYERYSKGGPAFSFYGAQDPDGSYAKKATEETHVVAKLALARAMQLKAKRSKITSKNK